LASSGIDLVLGTFLAYLVARKKLRLSWLVDSVAMVPLALPGLVLAFGYVATYSGTILDPLQNPIPLLVAGYAVRRLPFVFRASFAGFQQIGPQYEEAARSCGATEYRALKDVTLPLISVSLLSGGLLAFLFAMLEVSESMILAVKQEFFPVTREIYHLLSKVPDGPSVAAALGVLCMIMMAVGLISVAMLMGRELGRMFRI